MTTALVDRTGMAEFALAAAESSQVCVRPYVRMVLDRATGEHQMVPIPCGSTRESKCPSCATKARKLRVHQCREGWHREDEPEVPVNDDAFETVQEADHEPHQCLGDMGAAGTTRWVMDIAQQIADVQGMSLPDAMSTALAVACCPRADLTWLGLDPPAPTVGSVPDEVLEIPQRQRRSTRRIKGFPDLPRVPLNQMEGRTVGRAFTDERTGKRYQPSMFLTLTLPSYGRVRDGVPVDPAAYNYRRAALDALLFSRLVDRFWQNLRRCAGYKVQYFSAIEAQHRLAPHLHAAVRGAIPRAIVKAVTAGTYFAAWWPPIDHVIYDEETPVWDAEAARYVDPVTTAVLPSWDEATADIDKPMHVASFGRQLDVKGLLGGSEDSDRTVRYLCKYLTKSVSDTYTPDDPRRIVAYEQHIDRLHAEVLLLPCGPSCSNWLRFGVEPKSPTPGLIPGRCASAAHDRENLGIGGRRVLVSRQWSGKTLTEHRADRASVVREVLDMAGVEAPDANRLARTQTLPDGSPRFEWRDPDPILLDYTAVIVASLRQRMAWRLQYEEAKQQINATGPPVVWPVETCSAVE